MGAGTAAPRGWAGLPGQVRSYLKDPKNPPQLLLGTVLTAIWSCCEPAIDMTPKPSLAPSDNLQTPMNLVMPLRYPLVAFRAEFGMMLFEAADQILAGLNNVGTVHFARFDIVEGNLCMFSIYDGNFEGYIRDFIGTIGGAFDAIMTFVKDPPPTPCGQYVDEFIAWVHDHDSLQLPDLPTDVSSDLVALKRRTLVLLYRNRNAQMGVYRGYPGFSVAQIRDALGIGW